MGGFTAPAGFNRQDPEYQAALDEGNGRYDRTQGVAMSATLWIFAAMATIMKQWDGLCDKVAALPERPRQLVEAGLASALATAVLFLLWR